MKIYSKCPICQKEQMVDLSENEYKRYLQFSKGVGNIQDLLPELSASQREALISGICPECWETLKEDIEEEGEQYE